MEYVKNATLMYSRLKNVLFVERYYLYLYFFIKVKRSVKAVLEGEAKAEAAFFRRPRNSFCAWQMS
jgi:hypothetical protein